MPSAKSQIGHAKKINIFLGEIEQTLYEDFRTKEPVDFLW